MDHDGTRGRTARIGGGGLVRGTVLEVEPLGELEVELDGRALERATERILDFDVDLGAIECTVTRVELPLARVELVQRLGQLLWKVSQSAFAMREMKHDLDVRLQLRSTSRSPRGSSRDGSTVRAQIRTQTGHKYAA